MQACMKSAPSDGAQPTPPPYRKPDRTWAGYGSGRDCDLCHCTIGVQQIEYEVELVAGAALEVLHMHRQCFQEWAGD